MRRKGGARLYGYSGSFPSWKLSFKREGNAQVNPMTTSKVDKPLFVQKQVTNFK